MIARSVACYLCVVSFALTGLRARGVYRLDRAWLCPADERVYRMAYWQNSAGEVELPSGFRSHCCREARSQEARP